MHVPAKGSRDVHQRIEREARDSSPQQIIHARLRHARAARGIRLGPAVFINQRRDLVHQFGAQTQVRRLLRRVGHLVFIGGIAVYLHTINAENLADLAEATRDADLYISISGFSDLRDIEEVSANPRLSKHEFRKDGFSFDAARCAAFLQDHHLAMLESIRKDPEFLALALGNSKQAKEMRAKFALVLDRIKTAYGTSPDAPPGAGSKPA